MTYTLRPACRAAVLLTRQARGGSASGPWLARQLLYTSIYCSLPRQSTTTATNSLHLPIPIDQNVRLLAQNLDHNQPKMDAVSSYSFASLAWHSIQGLPLIIWPQAINGLLTMDNQTGMQPSSGVENYFARSLGFALLALGLVTVVLTGALPLNSMVESKLLSRIQSLCVRR